MTEIPTLYKSDNDDDRNQAILQLITQFKSINGYASINYHNEIKNFKKEYNQLIKLALVDSCSQVRKNSITLLRFLYPQLKISWLPTLVEAQLLSPFKLNIKNVFLKSSIYNIEYLLSLEALIKLNYCSEDLLEFIFKFLNSVLPVPKLHYEREVNLITDFIQRIKPNIFHLKHSDQFLDKLDIKLPNWEFFDTFYLDHLKNNVDVSLSSIAYIMCNLTTFKNYKEIISNYKLELSENKLKLKNLAGFKYFITHYHLFDHDLSVKILDYILQRHSKFSSFIGIIISTFQSFNINNSEKRQIIIINNIVFQKIFEAYFKSTDSSDRENLAKILNLSRDHVIKEANNLVKSIFRMWGTEKLNHYIIDILLEIFKYSNEALQSNCQELFEKYIHISIDQYGYSQSLLFKLFDSLLSLQQLMINNNNNNQYQQYIIEISTKLLQTIIKMLNAGSMDRHSVYINAILLGERYPFVPTDIINELIEEFLSKGGYVKSLLDNGILVNLLKNFLEHSDRQPAMKLYKSTLKYSFNKTIPYTTLLGLIRSSLVMDEQSYQELSLSKATICLGYFNRINSLVEMIRYQDEDHSILYDVIQLSSTPLEQLYKFIQPILSTQPQLSIKSLYKTFLEILKCLEKLPNSTSSTTTTTTKADIFNLLLDYILFVKAYIQHKQDWFFEIILLLKYSKILEIPIALYNLEKLIYLLKGDGIQLVWVPNELGLIQTQKSPYVTVLDKLSKIDATLGSTELQKSHLFNQYYQFNNSIIGHRNYSPTLNFPFYLVKEILSFLIFDISVTQYEKLEISMICWSVFEMVQQIFTNSTMELKLHGYSVSLNPKYCLLQNVPKFWNMQTHKVFNDKLDICEVYHCTDITFHQVVISNKLHTLILEPDQHHILYRTSVLEKNLTKLNTLKTYVKYVFHEQVLPLNEIKVIFESFPYLELVQIIVEKLDHTISKPMMTLIQCNQQSPRKLKLEFKGYILTTIRKEVFDVISPYYIEGKINYGTQDPVTLYSVLALIDNISKLSIEPPKNLTNVKFFENTQLSLVIGQSKTLKSLEITIENFNNLYYLLELLNHSKSIDSLIVIVNKMQLLPNDVDENINQTFQILSKNKSIHSFTLKTPNNNSPIFNIYSIDFKNFTNINQNYISFYRIN
ncbi:hypothetical protein DLAC_11605 [Tieghemostelium lacteum]|uniref:Uncharacterized protein n=1 Tax=Tieghemostelium lacteum TaxID=361077 RepID=A0A151ZHY1_TIELA|nr:hypothetical protein DLAC_11605 [Tieghemostelium lacteum]|eukprot:KYQ93573.1 hypothetical protein DLAC_11605 [Tieghemostelium lacteum]